MRHRRRRRYGGRRRPPFYTLATSLIVLSIGSIALILGLVWSVLWHFALVDDLRARIERQRPLILEKTGLTFHCTGSMEPTFGCLDSGTGVLNPRPENIVVGATVGYSDPSDPDKVGIHRVIDIKVEGGVHYFLTQGDNNSVPDGWTPETHIDGYLIDLHRNTRPENAHLRQAVLDAGAAAHEAWEALDAAWQTGDWARHDAAMRKYEPLREYADCWHTTARHATYFDDGRPPIYIPCRK